MAFVTRYYGEKAGNESENESGNQEEKWFSHAPQNSMAVSPTFRVVSRDLRDGSRAVRYNAEV